MSNVKHEAELGNGQPLIPIILTLVYEESQEWLNPLVDPFKLTVHLWVIDGRGCNSDTQYLAEGMHEVWHKLSSLVTDHFFQWPVEFPDVVSEQSCCSRGCDVGCCPV